MGQASRRLDLQANMGRQCNRYPYARFRWDMLRESANSVRNTDSLRRAAAALADLIMPRFA